MAQSAPPPAPPPSCSLARQQGCAATIEDLAGRIVPEATHLRRPRKDQCFLVADATPPPTL
ncbi:hypothetical protein CRG98_014447 [Punica granatum]|uniref:Uncharacterized protein n=1 Tax=Punica granatum TaxID=22663 RepID=A0A2I0KAJ0_PUNGR|nr:hypothetical protein CRG98_014447 [Punica granatum]